MSEPRHGKNSNDMDNFHEKDTKGFYRKLLLVLEDILEAQQVFRQRRQ